MSGSGARARTRRRRQRALSASRCGRRCGGSVPSWRLCGSRRAASAPLHRCTSAPLHLCTSASLPGPCPTSSQPLGPSAPTRTRQVVGLAEEARTGMAHVPRECAAAAALAGRNDARREAEQAILKRVIAQVCPPTLRRTLPPILASAHPAHTFDLSASSHPPIPHPSRILPSYHGSTHPLLACSLTLVCAQGLPERQARMLVGLPSAVVGGGGGDAVAARHGGARRAVATVSTVTSGSL